MEEEGDTTSGGNERLWVQTRSKNLAGGLGINKIYANKKLWRRAIGRVELVRSLLCAILGQL